MSHSVLTSITLVAGPAWSARSLPIQDVTDITMAGSISGTDYIQLDISADATPAEGKLRWHSDDGTLSVGMPGGTVELQIGQELMARSRNVSGATIDNGVPVFISGAQARRPTIEEGDASSITTSGIIALTTESIGNVSNGYITTTGLVREVDTSAWNEGDLLWLDNSPGGMTSTMPQAPNARVALGYVIWVHASEGILLVRPTIIPHLMNISGVYNAISPSDGDRLEYIDAESRWELRSTSDFFPNVVEGETPAVTIAGYRTGDVKRTLSMQVSATVNDQFEFSGLTTYAFDSGLAITVDDQYLTFGAGQAASVGVTSGTGALEIVNTAGNIYLSATGDNQVVIYCEPAVNAYGLDLTSDQRGLAVSTFGKVAATFSINNSAVDTALEVVRNIRGTTGTALAGIGLQLVDYVENGSGTSVIAGIHETGLTDVTNGAEVSYIAWHTRAGGATAEAMRLTSDGLTIEGSVGFSELSADPGDPAEGKSVMWQSDGTGSGDDGDVMIKITAGAVTKTVTLVDFSAF